MKRYITIALCALTVFGLGSCNKVHEEDFDNAGRSVTFQAQLGNDTRTGLALKFVPDWRQTTLSDVHIWEVAGSERYEGEDVKMRIPGEAEGNYEIALFKADFSNMTIIVNPPSNAPATRAGETYEYTAIVAPKDANGKFTVPSTQKPDTETLIDPHADFIVGKSPAAFDQSQAGKEVNLIFTRPVAISRLSIMNVSDPTIRQVRIYSSDKLTGSASYENVNFENATVSFDNSGSNVITLDYGSGVAMPAEGIFNAYFISLVGTKRITKIEVVTNAQTLTKEFEGGKALTFKVPDFKSIAVNMGDSVTPGPGEDQPQNIRFVRGTTTVTTDSYDLYSTAAYVSPTVTGQAQGATLTYESSDPAVATVSTQGVVTPVGPGETTISVDASKVEGYQAGHAEFTLTVTDSTPEPVDQPLKFMKGGQEVTSDTYDFYPGGAYVSPTLDGAVQGATVTWAITCVPEGCATIDADGKVTPVTVGAAVITATASAVAPLYKQTSKSYDLEIKDTTPVVGPTVTINLEEATELVAGEKYVLVSNGFALVRDGDDASAAAFDATAMTVAVPTDLQETLEWTLEKKSGSITRGNEYVFTQGAYFFGIAMNTNQTTYTYTVEVNNGRNVATNISIQDHNLSLANDLMYYAGNNSNYYVFYNTTDRIWDNEKVANTASPAATSKTALYKLKDMRAEQNPTFTAATAEYDLNGPRWTVAVPTLQNAKGTVDYESNNTTVAQVNASTGAVTIMNTARKGDTAVITAKANGNDEYKPGSASYTISIINSAPVTTTAYYKVDQIVAGQQYIVVSGGNALTVNGTTLGAVAVVDNNGVIETSEDVAVWTAAEHIEYYSGTSAAGHFTLKSGDNYLQRKSNQSNQTAAVGDVPSTGKYYVWEYDGTHLYHLSSASTTFYMGYADNVWKFNYQTPYYEASLYSTTEPEAPVVVEQELSFSPESVSGKVGETVTKPTLTGAMTTVTYSSSNTAVVEVNSDGDLTLKSVGEAIITATAAAETVGGVSYAEGTATYTVNVSPADTPPTEEKTYVKVDAITSGATYLIVSTDANNYNGLGKQRAFAGDQDGTAVVVDGTSGTITGSYSSYEFVITQSGSNYTLHGPNGYVTGNSSNTYSPQWIQVSSSEVTMSLTDAATLKAAASSDGLVSDAFYFYYLKGSSTEVLYFNSDGKFKIGGSGRKYGVYLYKLNDGTTPEPPTPVAQNLNFNPTSVSGKVGEAVTVPILSGAMTTVKYSSSNPTVAEVNESTGALKLNEAGSATITATAVAGIGSDGVTYAEGTATYTVNVSPADTPPTGEKTYVKVDAITSGATYLIVSADANNYNGYGQKRAFKGDTNGSVVELDGTSGTITGDYSACEFVITAEGENYSLKGPSGYVTGQSSTDPYIQVSTNKVTMSLTDAATLKAAASSDGLVSDAFYFYYLKGSSTEVLYLNSNGRFKIGGSGRKYGVYLYKLNDGGTTPVTPDPPTPTTQYYTKINSRDDLPGTSQTSATGDYLFVYENGTRAYVFKAICDGTPTGAGNTNNGHVELTKAGSAIEVDLTENGILATDAVKACKIQLAHHSTATRNDWTIKPASLGTYWVRVYNNGTNVRLLAMTSSGYSATFTFDGTGNNAELKRTDSNRDAYWTYNATANCFEGTATASKISIYKLSE